MTEPHLPPVLAEDRGGDLASRRAPHPIIWTILYFPFGALGGFIGVALTFLATRSGLSITEGSLLNGVQMLTSWLKWMWAPLVDLTLTPKRWYVFATTVSAIGVFALAAIPLGPDTLLVLLGIIAVASLINSMVGMSIEAIMATTIQPGQEGRVSAWFQAGNLGGAGVGGGLGLILLQVLPATWMSGAILGGLFMACCAALLAVPSAEKHVHTGGVATAIRGVFGDIREMVRTQGGVLSALLCSLPVGTGAAAGVLTQAEVAAHWGAGDTDVALLQGVFAGVVTAVGCFAGGWLCDRLRPRTAYALIGLALALVAVLMAVSPATVGMYRLWSLVYSFGVGLAYSAFTAVVLNAMGKGSAATKYNLFASLSNFPIWWLGLVLGRVADTSGADTMLLAEAGIGVIGVATFFAATRVVQRTRLPA